MRSNIASQPIFDADLRVRGYELLFRGRRAKPVTGTMMTAQVMVSALREVGLDNLVGDLPAFINVPQAMLQSRFLLSNDSSVPPSRLVLEVLEDTIPNPTLLRALEEHRAAGFTLALDDYVASEHQQTLLPYVDVIKVDLPGLSAEQIAERIAPLQAGTARLLAEKVETPEQFIVCRDLGFELFQGFLLSKPAASGLRPLLHADIAVPTPAV